MAVLLSYALTDLASVKELLSIDSGITTYDNLIIRKINQATEMIENYCQRRFAETTYTDEEYDATGVNALILKNRPITAFTNFDARNTSLNDNDWSDVDSQYYFRDDDAGVLELLFDANGRWNRYRVTYTAGYTTIPADIAEACASLAAYLTDNATSGTGVKSKQEGQRKIEYFDSNAGGNSSLFDTLGIQGILDSYANLIALDDR